MTSQSSTLHRVLTWLDTFSEWTGRTISWLTLLLVLVTFLVVVLRYAFSTGTIALQESIIYLHSIIFLVGIGYTLKRDGHVRVDIFYREMRPQRQALVNLLGTLLFLLPTAIFIFWISWQYVASSWSILEGSREAGGIPAVYLLKTLIPVMALLVVAQGVAEVIRSVLTLSGKSPTAEG